MLMIALAPALVQLTAAFAPPLDRPIAYRFSDMREDRGRTLRFSIDRRVTFRRTPGGIVADVETLSVEDNAPGASAMFAAMMSGMIGRTVRFRLDAAGRPIDIVDLDAHWDAHVAGITAAIATAKGNPAKVAAIRRIADARRATPTAERIQILAEMLTPLVADGINRVSPAHDITLPGRAADGSALSLSGTERTTEIAGGLLELNRSASGSVGGLTTRLTLHSRVDPRTGWFVIAANS